MRQALVKSGHVHVEEVPAPAVAEGRADLAHCLGVSGDLLAYVDRYRHEVAARYEKIYSAARDNARGPDTPGAMVCTDGLNR